MVSIEHKCPATTECGVMLPQHILMCKPHWYKVPKFLRDEVYRTWNRGKPKDWDEYLKVRQQAIDAVRG